MGKKYTVLSSKRFAQLLCSLKSIASKGNAGRACAKRMERAMVKQYAGVVVCNGRCVVPLPFVG